MRSITAPRRRLDSAAPRPVADAGEAIVAARAVAKTYDTGGVRVEALRDVELTVARGEMVAIMGPSGCGKTTLLNCLSGLDAIDAGEIVIEGTPLSTMSDAARTDYRARRMGFVFQFYNLLPVLTAAENVELPLLVARVRAGEARRRALAALTWWGSQTARGTSPTSSPAASASA
jgi:putative ABC transport system ATP-binding protein